MIQAVVLCIFLTFASAAAQITTVSSPPLPSGEAQVALEEARATAREALAADSSFRPDRPLVRETIRLARRAVNLAPEHPETLRFLAEVYGDSGFYGPAFSIWRRYAEAGGAWTRTLAAGLPRAASRSVTLGTTRAIRGARWQPTAPSPKSRRRTRRRSVGADAFCSSKTAPKLPSPTGNGCSELSPDDAGAAYFLELTQAGVAHGLEAARAFFGGVGDYEAGRLGAAREAFVRATSLAPDYAEAWGYRGRLAFEAGRFAAAQRAYARASELEPQNQTYRYFLRQAEARRVTEHVT